MINFKRKMELSSRGAMVWEQLSYQIKAALSMATCKMGLTTYLKIRG